MKILLFIINDNNYEIKNIYFYNIIKCKKLLRNCMLLDFFLKYER